MWLVMPAAVGEVRLIVPPAIRTRLLVPVGSDAVALTIAMPLRGVRHRTLVAVNAAVPAGGEQSIGEMGVVSNTVPSGPWRVTA